MNSSDLATWLCCLSEKEAAEFWKSVHPGRNFVEYTNDRDIKRFWDSPIGKFVVSVRAIFRFARNWPQKLDLLKWRIGFEWRRFEYRYFPNRK